MKKIPGLYSLTSFSKNLNCVIQLPFSKSESNRALIIQQLCDSKIELQNLSTSDDSEVLQQLLKSNETTLSSGAGGTTFRFLLALLAYKGKEKILSGDARFNLRPVKQLVEALNEIGANITYLENENFPPLKISKSNFSKNNFIEIDASVSSQFISAILMIAPCLPNGLEIKLTGQIVSMPYIMMTLKMMNYFGIDYSFENSLLKIQHQNYQPKSLSISADWSATSFIYQLAVLADSAEIFLPELIRNSFQGDEIVSDLMKQFGIETTFKTDGILIKKISKPLISSFNYNFINEPDLAMTFAFTCAALGMEATLNGLNNLSLKETDRISAIKNEIEKLGTNVDATSNSIHIFSNKNPKTNDLVFANYNDHRMVMAIAPLALTFEKIQFEEIKSVSKSFPNFFVELEKAQLGLNNL